MKPLYVLVFLIMFILTINLLADPNDIVLRDAYDLRSLDPITEEQRLAMRVNGTTLQEVLDIALDREINKAKRVLRTRLVRNKTLIQLQTDVNEISDPNL